MDLISFKVLKIVAKCQRFFSHYSVFYKTSACPEINLHVTVSSTFVMTSTCRSMFFNLGAKCFRESRTAHRPHSFWLAPRMQDLWDNQCQNADESKSDWLLYFTGSLRVRSFKTGNENVCDFFAGRFRSRQRRTMGKKSENGRCKLTKNRNTVKLMLEKTQKANWCRSHD